MKTTFFSFLFFFSFTTFADSNSYNFRDLFSSINQCYKKTIFRTEMAYRSNKRFSGKSCDEIKRPDVIYSLNFDLRDGVEYYCLLDKKGSQKLVGTHYNEDSIPEMHELTDLNNWEIPDYQKTVCAYFENIYINIDEGEKFLFHCSAGTDRTGALAAMLVATLAEAKGIMNEKLIKAIECDYEKSSLDDWKVGRMYEFITTLQNNYGSVTQFLMQKCTFSDNLIKKAAQKALK